jgi:hypothetical protein
MAVLDILPELDIIAGFKGTIDFYLWMGMPVARKWPRSPGKKRSPAVEAQWPAFTTAAREWRNLSPVMKDAYNALAHRSGLCGRDLQIRSYLTGLYRYPIP